MVAFFLGSVSQSVMSRAAGGGGPIDPPPPAGVGAFVADDVFMPGIYLGASSSVAWAGLFGKRPTLYTSGTNSIVTTGLPSGIARAISVPSSTGNSGIRSFNPISRIPVTGPFSCEAWFRYPTEALNVADGQMVFGETNSASSYRWRCTKQVWTGGTNANFFRLQIRPNGDDTGTITLDSPANLVRGAWYHVAVTRDAAGMVRLFVGGAMVASASVPTIQMQAGQNYNLAANSSTAQHGTSCEISLLRIHRSHCYYTENFAPPKDVDFRSQLEDQDGDPFFDDVIYLNSYEHGATNPQHSRQSFAISVSGLENITEFAKYGERSLRATSNLVQAKVITPQDYPAANHDGKSITAEMWVYYTGNRSAASGMCGGIGRYRTTNNLRSYHFGFEAGSSGFRPLAYIAYVGTALAVQLSATAFMAANAWHHVAYCYNKDTLTLRIFVNGVMSSKVTLTQQPAALDNLIDVYQYNAGTTAGATFYYDDVRLTHTCRYPTDNSFIPPAQKSPHYFALPTPAPTDVLPVTANLLYRFDASREVFEDTAGTIPARAWQPVALWGNSGGNQEDAQQPTLARRPVLGVDPVTGQRFIRAQHSLQQHFNDLLGMPQPSGLGVQFARTFFIVTRQIGNLANFPAIFGSTAANGGKVGIYFRSEATKQIHYYKAPLRIGTAITNAPQILTVVVASESTNRFALRQNGITLFDAVQTSNEDDPAAVTSTQFLRSTAITTGGFFDGDICEILAYSGQFAPANRAVVEQYLAAKWNIAI
jgi:hypothetical protein